MNDLHDIILDDDIKVVSLEELLEKKAQQEAQNTLPDMVGDDWDQEIYSDPISFVRA